jgi:DNA-binding MarR family transcriptional regulator
MKLLFIHYIVETLEPLDPMKASEIPSIAERKAAPDPSRREKLVRALGHELGALLSASRALTIESAANFHPDLAPAAFHIACWLHSFGPAKSSRVALEVGMDRSATSRLTAQMVNLGLVVASSDPHDGRGVVFKLTAKGESRIASASARKGQVFSERIADWSDADLTGFAALLHRFNNRLKLPIE